ncbi:MAG: phospho-N-acetylmuramoyl-pentapeptide-transferase, partial [Planctomycetes bacterium]|nr:phospho-N-acetylmuramoyl-pentapeptide-transferase [Planctomycetota bacterium]
MLYHLFDALYDHAGKPYAYENPLFRATCAMLLSFLLVWVLGPWFIRQLKRYSIGDPAEFDHAQLNVDNADKRNTPTMGGLLIMAVILFNVLLLADLKNYYITMGLFCMVWLTALGSVDDWLKLTIKRRTGTRDGLKMHEKLLFQIALAVLLGFYIYRHGEINATTIGGDQVQTFRILNVPFYKTGWELDQFAFFVITILVVTGTSNAVNLTDGMDGLASGCMVLCSFVFMALAFIGGRSPELAYSLLFPHIPHTAELAVLCGAMMGACMGFLWHNCYPAKVFMGDTGSLPLGGLIGYVAICTRQELMLFIVGGVFVIEA